MMKRMLISLTIFLFPLLLLFSCSAVDKSTDGEISDSTVAEKSEPQLKKIVPVEVQIIKSQVVSDKIPLTAILQPIHSVDVVAEVSGKILSIDKKLGDYVSLSDTLAIIDDRLPLIQYKEARAQVFSARNNVKIASLNLESDKELFEVGDISKIAYENSLFASKNADANLLTAKANLERMEKNYLDTRIMSPINGQISRKYIDIGQMVTMGSPLYRVVDLRIMKMSVGLPQNAISRVKRGSAAKIQISALNNKMMDGDVQYISPEADENSGAFLAEIHVKNDEKFSLKAGMTGKINLILSNDEKELVIPNYAMIVKNGSNYVYKVSDKMASLTEISVGKVYGGQIAVEQGVSEGDTIVVVGMKKLGVETEVLMETIHQ